MVGQPKDTPFGLEPNVAAGLAYLLVIVGGILMLVGGGTNRFVRWSAAQSITLWVGWAVLWFVIDFIFALLHVFAIILLPVLFVLPLVGLFLWLWTTITAFQGKEVRVPFIADLTQSIFKTTLG
jgi:uncharacterized membrane protein